MEQRNLKHEEKFRKYLFKFNFETHKKILENLGLKKHYESIEGFNILMEYFDSISDEEKPKVDRQLKKLGL